MVSPCDKRFYDLRIFQSSEIGFKASNQASRLTERQDGALNPILIWLSEKIQPPSLPSTGPGFTAALTESFGHQLFHFMFAVAGN